MNLQTMIKAASELMGRKISDEAAILLMNQLSKYEETKVIKAFEKCMGELTRFPTIAEIIARIDDGRPSADEAWAMCPKHESQSAVWTKETSKAFFAVALPILDSDEYGARKAFIEKYNSLVVEARNNNVTVQWDISLGQDKMGRIAVVREAVEKKRISLESAVQSVPEIEHQPGLASLKEIGMSNIFGVVPK